MPARRTKTAPKAPTGGLTAKSFGGLSKKRYTSNANPNFGLDIRFTKDNPGPFPVQFLGDPDDELCFAEYEQHSWQEGGKWNFVPCIGDDCPLCEEEDTNISKRGYRFIALVWDFKEKKVRVLPGPKDLAGRIAYAYEKAEKIRTTKSSAPKFTRRVYDVLRLDKTPISYDVANNEELSALRTIPEHKISLQKYIQDQVTRYYGEDAGTGKTSLDEPDDDDDADDDEDDDDTPPVRRRRKKSTASTTKSTSTATTRKRRVRR